MHKNKAGMMTPFKPAFGGGEMPREAKPRGMALSQTYKPGQGSVIPDAEGRIMIRGSELRTHLRSKR